MQPQPKLRTATGRALHTDLFALARPYKTEAFTHNHPTQLESNQAVDGCKVS